MKYIIIILIPLLSGCAGFRDTYDTVKYHTRHGYTFSNDITLNTKGKYIYVYKNKSGFKYGYDYGRAMLIIKFKTKF